MIGIDGKELKSNNTLIDYNVNDECQKCICCKNVYNIYDETKISIPKIYFKKCKLANKKLTLLGSYTKCNIECSKLLLPSIPNQLPLKYHGLEEFFLNAQKNKLSIKNSDLYTCSKNKNYHVYLGYNKNGYVRSKFRLINCKIVSDVFIYTLCSLTFSSFELVSNKLSCIADCNNFYNFNLKNFYGEAKFTSFNNFNTRQFINETIDKKICLTYIANSDVIARNIDTLKVKINSSRKIKIVVLKVNYIKIDVYKHFKGDISSIEIIVLNERYSPKEIIIEKISKKKINCDKSLRIHTI